MKAYISISYNNRQDMQKEIGVIKDVLLSFDILPLVFVDTYNFHPDQERQMMQQAISDIDSCDILIAETTNKGIGIGIEVGYAKAKKKPVIYIRQKNAGHSTTVSGISDFQIIYETLDDLQSQLTDILMQPLHIL